MRLSKIIASSLFICLLVILTAMVNPGKAVGQQNEPMHPRNQLLINLGMMPDGLLHPSVPRVTASQALLMYQSGQARIAWVGEDGEKVVGAYHFRGTTVYNMADKVRLADGQALLLYCD